MQAALLSLLLLVALVSMPVECTTKLQDRETPSQHQRRRFNSHSEGSTTTAGFYMELRGSMRKGVHRRFLVVLPVRSDTSDTVLIFDLRRRRFLCVDLTGELYSSRLKDRRGCLFRRVWSDAGRHRALLLSVGGGRLLTLQGAEKSARRRRRRRRSQEVNPSDPLRSQPHPSNPARDHKDVDPGQPEQDQSGAVSKETITSCDDPLRVLRPNAPGSPVKTNIADRPEHN